MSGAATTEFEPIGTGFNVYESAESVEGRARWLDSPEDVIAFVESGESVEDVIVIARGGTTTFLTMVLNAGVRGILTLQGAPQSHLGILTREYGIPCIMSVAFTHGVRSARGETIPADGVRLRMDVSGKPTGTVSVEAGAPVDDSPLAEAAPGMTPEQLEAVMALLANFQGEVPHGVPGHEVMMARQTTAVLDLTDDSMDHDLSIQETNDVIGYLAWNEWDCLAERATEGESGLIPRQEYEAMGILASWFSHESWLKTIEAAVGKQGCVDLGRIGRQEIGSKINLLHVWAATSTAAFGRGIALELGLHDETWRSGTITETTTIIRRFFKGLWGSGPIFASQRGYTAEILERSWIDRFEHERIDFVDDADQSAFQRFSSAVELCGFLLHFDNRLGLAETGPYPTDDGGFVIVRDLFINEPAFPWSDSLEGLPYAVTIAMFFPPDTGLTVTMYDLSTMFTEPANYLHHITGMAVYSREKHDTPMDQIKVLSREDMATLRQECEAKSEALYRRIAAMSWRERVLGGANVYTMGFLLALARAAGVYDELVENQGFLEVHPVAEACYDTIVAGVAKEMIPRMFLTTSWANPIPAESSDRLEAAPDERAVMAALRARGFAGAEAISVSSGVPVEQVRSVLATAASSGLVQEVNGRVSGATLTGTGRARALLLAADALTAEGATALTAAYDDFLEPNHALKELTTDWQLGTATDARHRLAVVHSAALQVVEGASAAEPRFGRYAGRLQTAYDAFTGGADDALATPMSESYHDIWMELHEDLLATLGRSRSEHDG
jgi:PEP-utilising enzyme, mobile domain